MEGFEASSSLFNLRDFHSCLSLSQLDAEIHPVNLDELERISGWPLDIQPVHVGRKKTSFSIG